MQMLHGGSQREREREFASTGSIKNLTTTVVVRFLTEPKL